MENNNAVIEQTSQSAETKAPKFNPSKGEEWKRPDGVKSFEDRFKEGLKAAEPKADSTSQENKNPTPDPENSEIKSSETSSEERPINPLLEAFKKPEKIENKEEKPQETNGLSTDKETNLANLRKKAKAFEGERDTYKQELTLLKAELEKAKSSVPSDYEQLKADYKTVTDALKKYSLAETPEFKRKFDEKLGNSKKVLERVLRNTDVSIEDFVKIVESPDSKERRQKIAELTSEVDDFSKSSILNQVAAYDAIRAEREQELSNPDPALIQFTEKQKQDQDAKRQQFEGYIDSTFSEAIKEFPWLDENGDFPDELKAEASNIKRIATHAWKQGLPVEQQAKLVLAGAMTPTLFKMLEASQSELAAANETIKKLRGITPNTSAERTTEQKPQRRSFQQHVSDLMAGKG